MILKRIFIQCTIILLSTGVLMGIFGGNNGMSIDRGNNLERSDLVYAQQNLPQEYYPNYHIDEEWNALLNYFIDIQAASRVGTELEPTMFYDMSQIFDVVFEYFPQSSTNEVIYRQCKLITDDLSNSVTRSKYVTFKERCYQPLGTIIDDINTRYVVEADIEANPDDGSAPLNVTFDGRDSVDPSNDTIPSANFFWRYKDVFGVEQPIGKGPVVNYTFNEPGNHIVHLTVRSSNNFRDGIFDGEDSVQVNVAPKAANMVVYVNGQKTDVNKITKISTQDAEDGVLIDATATVPIGARTIQEYTWDIIGQNGTRYNDTIESTGSPGQFIYNFPGAGVYNLKLEIIDNEGNRMSETYAISISDPVASGRVSPEEGGTTSSTYKFNARRSYSVTSNIDRYQWTITDPEGNQIENRENRSFERTFTQPGTYTAKLTVTDTQGNSSIDTTQFDVGSTPPVPGFIIVDSQEREKPSQFLLDANSTFDQDVTVGNDSLTYSRAFSNNENVTILRELEDNKSRIRVSMNQVGTYKVQLTVEDSYGERASVEKEIKVESTLRPELNLQPQVGVWGEEVRFVAKTNKNVAFYQWDFGDGQTQQTQDPVASHTYKSAGNYQVTLTVVTDDGEENSIQRSVFMGQAESPIAAYEVKGSGNSVLQQSAVCENSQGEEQQAYTVNRYQNITIDGTKSKNAQGGTNGINHSFNPKNDQVYNRSVLSYGFPEVGCTYIDLFVEDTNLGRTQQTRIRFDVVNALPELQNLTVTFPQAGGGGNPFGPGMNPTELDEETNLFDNPSIIVKVQAKGARDRDGFISHFRWFYYPTDDPLRKEGFKITPGNVPYTTFVIPKPLYPTEYSFEVEMIDNNQGKISSLDIVGQGPTVFFPPDEDSLDIPIVTLTTDRLTTRVGEEVTFRTNASILSENPNFETDRYFKYDFDGDGVYDIQSTKKSTVTHTYTEAGSVNPKVSVYFKGRAGVGSTETVTVLKGVRPNYEVETLGNRALVKNFSQGEIIDTAFCMDDARCTLTEQSDAISGSTQIGSGIISTSGAFLYEYPEPGRYLSTIQVTDEFSNIQTRQRYVDITENDRQFGMLSIPRSSKSDGTYSIGVSNNEVSVYPLRRGSGNCFIDLDNTVDSDGDGDPLYDQDISCNSLETLTFQPTQNEQVGTIYYVQGGDIIETPLIFEFLNYEEPINDQRNRAREEIDRIITSLNSNTQQTGMDYYKELLRNLRQSLGEINEVDSIIAQMIDYEDQNTLLITEKQSDDIAMLLRELSSNEIREVYGDTPYEIAKDEILTWFSSEDRSVLQDYFREFEDASGNREAMKLAIDKIYTFAANSRMDNTIDEVDFNYIKNQLCEIVLEYNLPSQTCGTEADTDQVEDEDDQESGGLLSTVLKIILWVVIGLAVVFIVIVVIFAIKAKKRNALQEDEKEQEESASE